MSRKTPQTEELTRYLLGDMPEEERARLEDEFLGDEGLFQRVADAENDLLDDYVGGRLDARARERLEQHYLRLPGSRERLRTARLIARERAAHAEPAAIREEKVGPERPGLWESLRAFWRGSFPSFTPYAVGLAVVALVVGGIWWAVTRGVRDEGPHPTELARAIPSATPFPTVQETPEPAPTPEQTDTPRETRPNPTPTRARPRTEPSAPVVLALVAGLTRGDGAANRLVVPKGADAVRLEFGLGEGSYKDVRASLRTVEGREVWSGSVRPPRDGRRAALSLPARLFSSEDYLLILSGTDAAGERVEFQEFYFNAEVR